MEQDPYFAVTVANKFIKSAVFKMNVINLNIP